MPEKSSLALLLAVIISVSFDCPNRETKRREISLNGTLDIARIDLLSGGPSFYTGRVPVPGLVDLSEPSLDTQDTAYKNSLYRYRKKFTLDDQVNSFAGLKGYKSVRRQMVRLGINDHCPGLNDRLQHITTKHNQ